MTAGADLPARSSIEAADSKHQPNPKRPSNPFTPSSEPDWIVVPKSAVSQGRGNQRTSRPPSTQVSRHPPASFDPAESLPSSSVHVNGGPLTSNRASMSRTASFASSASSSKGASRKPAPPIPKKPELLTRNSSQQSGLGSQRKDDPRLSSARMTSPTNTPRRELVSPSLSGLGFPPPPRRNVHRSQAFPPNRHTPTLPPPRVSRRLSPNLADESRPPLPPRRPSEIAVNPGGIMDENDGGAQSIPSLQPRRA